MQAGGIAAVMLHVGDVPAAQAWYQALFPQTRPLDLGVPGVGCLQIGSVRLELVSADAQVASGAAGSVVYWQVAHLQTALAHALSHGATLYRGPMAIEDGQAMCQVRDPWGNCVGLRGLAAATVDEGLQVIRALEAQGRIAEAVTLGERLLALTPEGSLARADLLRMQAHLLDWHRSQYAQCEVLLLQELAIRQSLQDPTTSHTLFQLGLIVSFMGREADAQRHLQAALALTDDALLLAKIENLLGDLLVPHDPPQAKRWLTSAADRLRAAPDAYLQGHVALSLAWLNAVQGQVAQGEAACREGLRQAESARSAGLLGTAHLRLAQILQLGHRLADARHHASQAARVGAENHWQVLVDEASGLLKQLPPA